MSSGILSLWRLLMKIATFVQLTICDTPRAYVRGLLDDPIRTPGWFAWVFLPSLDAWSSGG